MKKDIVFTLPAEAVEGATEAMLLGDFNNWSPAKEFELKKQADGSYKTVVQLEAGKTYQYRFLLNNGRWVNDYHAQHYVPVSGLSIDNCVITVDEVLDIDINQPTKSEKPAAIKEAAPAKAKKPAQKTSVKTETDKIKEPKAKAPAKAAPKEKAAKPAAVKAKTKKVEGAAKTVKKGTSATGE